MNEDRELEVGYVSLTKHDEELCGDHVESSQSENGDYTLVLADGLGSGVEANILSTLTSSIIARMMAEGLSIEESVKTIARTLPIAEDRGGIAYSTFTVLQIKNSSEVTCYNYDNPEPILLCGGRETPLSWETLEIEGKKIYKAEVSLSLGDVVVLLTDGMVYAGVGERLNFGWTRKEIVGYLERFYSPINGAKDIATVLLDACDDLYNRRPGDDATCCAVRLRSRTPVNILVGPAANSEDDEKMLRLFFAKEGKHIVCGGTTAKIAAGYLRKSILTSFDYPDKDIPPISQIAGVDLVTEGCLTLNRVLALADDYLGQNKKYFVWSCGQDGASLVARLLFEEATDINFYAGCAVNPAHQDPRFKIGFSMKMQIVDELAKKLKAMGKHIRVSYF